MEKKSYLKNLKIKAEGPIGKSKDFIEEEQLLDADLWKDCVNVFTNNCDDADCGWRGEFWGKMLRGAALVYSVDKNPVLYERMTETIQDLLVVEEKRGVLSSYSEEKQYSGWDLWSRKYVMLGLEYFLEVCEEEALRERIIACLMRQAKIIMAHVGSGEEQIPITKTSDIHGGMNSASILEPFAKLYGLTKDNTVKQFVEYIINTGACDSENIFENAFQDEKFPYEYKEKKAYEMMSCFEGLLEYYKLTGKEKYLQSVVRFIDKMEQSEETVIGCLGCDTEYLDHAKETQTEFKDDVMQETCVTVTWMKLCYKVHKMTGDVKYIRYIDRSFYNAMYGAMNFVKLPIQLYLQDGKIYMPVDSYAPLIERPRRSLIAGGKWVTPELLCGCCCSISSAGIGIAGQNLLLRDERGFVLNLYEKSIMETTTPIGNSFILREETNYPREGKIKFELELEKSEQFSLKFRIPEFGKHFTIAVNGEEVFMSPENHYVCIERTWQSGDLENLDIKYSFHELSCNGKISYQYGPFVLATDSSIGLSDVEREDETFTVGDKFFYKANLKNGCESLCCFESDGKVYLDYASAGKNPSEESSLVTVWF